MKRFTVHYPVPRHMPASVFFYIRGCSQWEVLLHTILYQDTCLHQFFFYIRGCSQWEVLLHTILYQDTCLHQFFFYIRGCSQWEVLLHTILYQGHMPASGPHSYPSRGETRQGDHAIWHVYSSLVTQYLLLFQSQFRQMENCYSKEHYIHHQYTCLFPTLSCHGPYMCMRYEWDVVFAVVVSRWAQVFGFNSGGSDGGNPIGGFSVDIIDD